MDGKRAKRDRALAELAGRQHGVVSIGQLRAVGISDDAVRGRVRAGRLHRIHRGVYGVGHRALSNDGRWMAAVLACGSAGGSNDDGGAREPGRSDRGAPATGSVLDRWGAALSHRSAAEQWGLLSAGDGPVDISIPGNGGRARRMGIRMHRSHLLLPAAVTSRCGVPVTTPAKTIADLRKASTGRRRLVASWELRRAIRQASVLGLPIDEDERSDRTRSDLERDFMTLCRRHCLPMPEVNARLGRYLVDFLWPDRRLVVETDGYRYHRGRAAFEEDRARDLDLRALGYEVVRLADRQLTREPDRIADILRDRLATYPSNGPKSRQFAP